MFVRPRCAPFGLQVSVVNPRRRPWLAPPCTPPRHSWLPPSHPVQGLQLAFSPLFLTACNSTAFLTGPSCVCPLLCKPWGRPPRTPRPPPFPLHYSSPPLPCPSPPSALLFSLSPGVPLHPPPSSSSLLPHMYLYDLLLLPSSLLSLVTVLPDIVLMSHKLSPSRLPLYIQPFLPSVLP